jgi:transposase
LYGSGYPTREIETITGAERRVLLRWYAKYRRGGPVALYDQRKGGNHRALTAEQLADVRAKLHQYRPVDVLGQGQVATADGLHWTVPDLKRALAMWQDVSYGSDTSYRTLLKRCGFIFQRTSKQYRSRSEVRLAEFEEQLEKN